VHGGAIAIDNATRAACDAVLDARRAEIILEAALKLLGT
jgi:hypothetical protein